MSRLGGLLSLVFAFSLLMIGCDSQLTEPSSEPVAGVQQGQGGPPGGNGPGSQTGPPDRAGPSGECDVTVGDAPAPYQEVQAGVDAASPGDRVCVEAAGGPYVEQVVIEKDLTLVGLGDPSPVVSRPASPDAFTVPESGPTFEPVLFAFGGSESDGAVSGGEVVEVTVKQITVDGAETQPEAPRAVGILLRNVDGAVEENTVRDMAVGGKETMGILAYGDSELTVTGNVVSGYERGGIGANGDGGAHPAPEVVIADNEVVGSTGIGEAWGPNGIQVGYGASGRIVGNEVRDNRYAEEAPTASCIIVFESDELQVRENEVRNCDVGVAVGSWGWFRSSADDTKITGNRVTEAFAGIYLAAVAFDGFTETDPSVVNSKIVRNELTDGLDGGTGITVAVTDAHPDFSPVASKNKLINNRISGFDTEIVDEGSGSKVHANDGNPAFQ